MLSHLAALLLAVAPGAMLGWALPAGRYRWAVWAASPALTLGLTGTSMGWLPRLGLPDSALAVLVGELVLAVVAVLVTRVVLSRRRRPDASAGPAAPASTATPGGPTGVDGILHRLGLPRLLDLVGVGIPAVFTVVVGTRFLGGLDQPPGWDGMNHAFFVRRILQTGSTAIDDVCVTGSTLPEPSCSFYPLAADVQWAQVAQLNGGHVGLAMLGWGILVAPLAMVVGVYAAVRVLGGRPVVAACAAAAPSLLGPLWISLRTGRMTEQAAPCMAAGVALLVALAWRGRHPVRMGLLAGLAGVGIVLSHSYDVLFMATVAVGMVLVVPERLRIRGLLSGLAAMAVAGLAGLAPFARAILGAGGERTASDPVYSGFSESFRFWVLDFDRYVLFGFPPPGTKNSVQDVASISVALWITLVVLCAAPLCFVLKPLRWARPWVGAGLVWTALGIWTSYSSNPVALALSGLWYGIRERVRNMIMPVYGLTALAGACAIGLVLYWLVRRAVGALRGARFGPHLASASAAVLFLSALTASAASADARIPLRDDLLSRSAVDAPYAKTWSWLRDHTDPGAVVAYDRHLEFMTWSYADYGTGLLFGIPPLTESSKRDYEQRRAAFEWLAHTVGSRQSGCLVRKYDIEYLAVGKRRMPAWHATYSRARLSTSPNVRLVHRDGDLQVYQVTPEGRACAGATS